MNRCLICSIFALAMLIPPGAASPRDLPLVQQAHFAYVGSFALPDGDFGASRFGYGGKGLCHYKDPVSGKDTLFMQGHDWYPGCVAQVEVPAVGGTASVLQNFTEITEGALGSLASSDSNIYGMLVYNGRLIVGASCYYDGDASQVNSHGVSGLTLSAGGDFHGFYPLSATANPRSLGGYMTTIPPEWQTLLGGPALTGKGCLSIISNNSAGPCATVFDPDTVGVSNPIPGTTLIFYPIEHPLAPEASTNELFNLATHMAGIAFPRGSRSVLFFGRQGIGTYCYGDASVCTDPCDASHGTHAYPYRHQVWAYDANDLLQVRSGTKQCWEMHPYAIWTLDGMPSGDCADMEGAAFDPDTGRLYITESYAEEPHVHVYRIDVPEAVARDGDINGDLACNMQDAVVTANVVVANLLPGTPPCVRALACDFDFDGSLGAGDLLVLCRYLAGTIPALETCTNGPQPF